MTPATPARRLTRAERLYLDPFDDGPDDTAPMVADPLFYLTWAEHPEFEAGWVLVEMELERKFAEATARFAPDQGIDYGSIAALGLTPEPRPIIDDTLVMVDPPPAPGVWRDRARAFIALVEDWVR